MRLHDFLDFHARETPDAEFALFAQRSFSYGDAWKAVNQLANALIAEGLAVGDRVGILAKNCLEYPLFYFACSKAGVVPVPLNYRLAPPELRYILQDSGAKLVLARGELVGALESVRADLPAVQRFVALEAEAPAGWVDYEAWRAGQSTDAPALEIAADHPVYQMYTSGTTGRPKGAVVTHDAVVSNIYQLQIGLFLVRDERYLIVVPLYHAAAAMALFVTIAQGGAAYIQEDFVPHDVVRALSEGGVVLATLVPAMIQACLVMVPDVAERKYARLRRMVYGASPVGEQTLRRALEVFGCEFVQGYGMTESTAVLTLLSAEDHKRALRERHELLRSCGRPVVGTRIRIVDAEGNVLPRGEVGEIEARGPQLMREYWHLDEATAKALGDGWLRTGDIGTIDAEGYVYILDRAKDMIVSGGENVYPNEIENVLFSHPAVADAAVIGVPDARWGEAVKAIVVLKAGQDSSDEELRQFCRDALAGYKVPKSIDFVPELPRNASGKVLKTELREPYWKGHTRRVS